MILPRQEIRRRGMVTPWSERSRVEPTLSFPNGLSYGAGPASYDVRARETHLVSAGGCVRIRTIERFDMPLDVAGVVMTKSSWIGVGGQVTTGLLDPGWRGHLEIAFANLGRHAYLRVRDGDPIAQVVFYALVAPTEAGYEGARQGQGEVA